MTRWLPGGLICTTLCPTWHVASLAPLGLIDYSRQVLEFACNVWVSIGPMFCCHYACSYMAPVDASVWGAVAGGGAGLAVGMQGFLFVACVTTSCVCWHCTLSTLSVTGSWQVVANDLWALSDTQVGKGDTALCLLVSCREVDGS